MNILNRIEMPLFVIGLIICMYTGIKVITFSYASMLDIGYTSAQNVLYGKFYYIHVLLIVVGTGAAAWTMLLIHEKNIPYTKWTTTSVLGLVTVAIRYIDIWKYEKFFNSPETQLSLFGYWSEPLFVWLLIYGGALTFIASLIKSIWEKYRKNK